MQRPQRNLLIILSAIATIWILAGLLPGRVALGCAAIGLPGILVLLLQGRDFLAGRLYARRREWRKALECYQRFEQKLLRRSGTWRTLVCLGVYSFDGVAITRNHIGHSLMCLGELDAAVRWLHAALRCDPLYAVPYLTLGTIAALRGDEATAQLEFRKAVELGYSPADAQALLRRALARARDSASCDR